jgi:hypothetical protein
MLSKARIGITLPSLGSAGLYSSAVAASAPMRRPEARPGGAGERTVTAGTSPTIDDPCLSEGGLDQNIYGTRP